MMSPSGNPWLVITLLVVIVLILILVIVYLLNKIEDVRNKLYDRTEKTIETNANFAALLERLLRDVLDIKTDLKTEMRETRTQLLSAIKAYSKNE